jgi:putative FmdB family regulatory protein
MPIYEYGCRSCGHTLDALQKIGAKLLRKCPECGKPALQRLVSAPAFRLKGGGWYETDFKADGEKKRNLADTGADKPKEEGKRKEDGNGKEEGKSKHGKADTKTAGEEKAASSSADAKGAKGAAKSTAKRTGSEAA